VLAIGKIVSPRNITFVSRISNNRFCIFLSSKQILDNLIDTHPFITINNQKLQIRRLNNLAKRIVISNVCPSINNQSILEQLNDIILIKFDGHSREYLSIDTVTSTDDAIHYPQEFLNSLSPSGFPPHKLKLKICVPITLLRILQPPNIYNSTRLQIKSLRNNIIEAVNLTGPAKG
jgi:hypothetical protein